MNTHIITIFDHDGWNVNLSTNLVIIIYRGLKYHIHTSYDDGDGHAVMMRVMATMMMLRLTME